MRTIAEEKGYAGTEFYVLDLDSEPVRIKFSHQIDDLMISSPDGDVLISWDMEEWSDDDCLLVKAHDNLKEFGNLRCSSLLLKSRTGDKIKVWATVQRN